MNIAGINVNETMSTGNTPTLGCVKTASAINVIIEIINNIFIILFLLLFYCIPKWYDPGDNTFPMINNFSILHIWRHSRVN